MVTVVPEGAGYLQALQIRVLKGRLFSDADLAANTGAVIIDREAARRFYGDADPVGRTLPFDNSLLTVVGVVENVRYAGLTGPREATIYRPFEQSPIRLLNLVARTADNASQVAADMRQIVRDYDPDIGIVSIQPMTDWVTQAVAEPRGRALLVSVIAGMTLVLAVIGLYGVVAYATLQRVREIGVRMALGASRRDVVGMIVGDAAVLAVSGVAIGIGTAYFATRALTTFLHGVTTTDPVSFGAAALALIAVTIAASCVPAQKAARTDPAAVLRNE